MKAVKEKGAEELEGFSRRVSRQYAMRRISKIDHDFLIVEVDKVRQRVLNMWEEDADG